VKRLASEAITLTVCPLSNLKLCVVPSMDDHPIDRMLAQGLRATINSDDPAYFGGYVNDNYRAAARARGLSYNDLATLARNSFLGSFLDPAEISARLEQVDAYAKAFPGNAAQQGN
jgi:adenosine deaminase